MTRAFTLLLTSIIAFSTSAQQLEWINSYGSVSAFADIINAVVTDDDGNVFITGAYHGQIEFGAYTLPAQESDNIFIAKLDSMGVCQWVQSYGGETVGDERPFDIAIDQEGNLIITGNFFGETTLGGLSFSSSFNGSDIFVLKTDASGNPIWARAFEGTGYDITHGIDIDADNNIIASGQTSSATLTMDSYVLSTIANNANESLVFKLHADGNVLWASTVGAPGGFFNSNNSLDLAVDSEGNIYTTGYFVGSATFGSISVSGVADYTYYLAKYSDSGQIQWVKKGDGPGDGLSGFGVAVSSDNHIATTGYYKGAVDFNTTTAPYANNWNIFMLEYDQSGNLTWSTFGTDSSQWSGSSARGYTVSYDESDNLFVSGRGSFGASIFGEPPSFYVESTLIQGDIFVLRFDPSKTLETCSWLQTSDPFTNCCAFPDDEDSWYSSSFQKHASFGNSVYVIENFIDNNQSVSTFSIAHTTDTTEVLRFGNGDFLVAKFNTVAVPDIVTTLESEGNDLAASVFPNPTSNYLEVQLEAQPIDMNYELFNGLGNLVATGIIQSQNTVIDASRLSNDVYLLRLTENGSVSHHTRIVVMH